jgi:hypothetical protein
MKLFITTAGIALIMASCNSGKPKEETKPEINKDTVVTVVADTGSTNRQTETGVSEPDLGGVGDLVVGLPHTKVIELLGEPGSKDKAIEWGADGMMHQNWFYKAKGISLNMDSNKDMTDQAISSITIISPCTFKTKKNIGIGSTYQQVMAAYEKEIDKSSSDKTKIVVGSIYGGIIIDFKNDKAESIFIGAAAE